MMMIFRTDRGVGNNHMYTQGPMIIEGVAEKPVVAASESLGTGNASRNIPDTMCGLVGTFLISAKMFLIPCVLWAISGTISNIFLMPNNIRNNLCVPDIMRNHFTNVPNMAMPILIFLLCYALFLC
jgi:hypothetical protein